MKKSFLLFLSSIIAVFLVTGCAEESKNNNGSTTTPPSVVPIDPSNPSSLTDLLGNYEIVFFYTDGAGMLPISSDCSKVEFYTGKADAKCVQGHNSVDFKGYGRVGVDNPASPTTINITTKMQMTNECLKNPTVGACANDALGPINYWSQAQNNQYNYNVFTPIPVTAIANGDINDVESAVTGVDGRHLKANVNTTGSTYKFELLSDGTVRNTMVDRSNLAPADVTVIMKKIESIPSDYTMDKDVQFPQPVIEGFVDSPAAATAE